MFLVVAQLLFQRDAAVLREQVSLEAARRAEACTREDELRVTVKELKVRLRLRLQPCSKV